MPEAINHEPVRSRPRLLEVLGRGWRRRCPRCGQGPLFERGIKTFKSCPVCHLVYQSDQGNTIMFMMITDRVPLLLGIALVFFGFHPQNWLITAAFFLAVAAPLLATLRQRQGLAIALDYLWGYHLGGEANQQHDAGAQRSR